MSDAARKRALVIIRHSPYGSSLGRAALDTALAMAAFEQPVDILFMGDGTGLLNGVMHHGIFSPKIL